MLVGIHLVIPRSSLGMVGEGKRPNWTLGSLGDYIAAVPYGANPR